MFEKGRGTDINIDQAFDWYHKSAKQRYAKAQFKMGYMHYKGIGVERNVDKAYRHLKKPADKGYARAQFYLGKLYAGGEGVIKDPKKALIWYSRASLGGYAPADHELATIKKIIANIEKSDIAKKFVKKSGLLLKKNKSKSRKNKKVKIVAVKQKPSPLDLVIKDILKGVWVYRKRPSEFLPSQLTKCEKTSKTIMECLSRKLMRNNGTADIIYITKALLYDIDQSGEFKVAYRNNVTDVIVHEIVYDEDDEDDEDVDNSEGDEEEERSEPPKTIIKKGWQDTEHQLVCKINELGTIDCIKNKTRKLVYTSKI